MTIRADIPLELNLLPLFLLDNQRYELDNQS